MYNLDALELIVENIAWVVVSFSVWPKSVLKIWNLDSEQKEDIFNDRIFCTDQDVDQLNKNDHYELNKGQYTTYDDYDNTYLVIWKIEKEIH